MLRQLFRRITGLHPSLTCNHCGYRVPYLGSLDEQGARGFIHWEALHEKEMR